MPTSNEMLVFDALRFEPSLSLTSSIVSVDAIEREIANLSAGMSTLCVRAVGSRVPSEATFERALDSIRMARNFNQASALLNMPVVALPDTPSLWGHLVREALHNAVPSRRGIRVLFVTPSMRRVPIVRMQMFKKLLRTLVASRSRMPAEEGVLAVPAGAESPEVATARSPVVAEHADDAALAAAIEMRNAVLKSETWLTSAQVAEHARGELLDSNPHQHASRLRLERRLLGARLGGQYLHPAFQFETSGLPHPKMRELLALLPNDDNGWTAALWCFTPTRKVGGARPADIFQAQPDDVIDAARRTFKGDDADW